MFLTCKLQNVANQPIELVKCNIAVECFFFPCLKYIVKIVGYVDSRKLGWLRRFVPCTTSIYTKKEMALIHLLLKFCCSVLPLAESMPPPQWLVSY